MKDTPVDSSSSVVYKWILEMKWTLRRTQPLYKCPKLSQYNYTHRSSLIDGDKFGQIKIWKYIHDCNLF